VKRKAARRRARARRADKYELYEKSVQEPSADLALMHRATAAGGLLRHGAARL
jgi:hypothetical protein